MKKIWVNLSLYKSANEIFKKRDNYGKRDHCVYQWRFINRPNFPAYTGQGNENRPTEHNNDLLALTKKKLQMELYLLADGLTAFEAQVYEAQLLRTYSFEYSFSKRGVMDWDGYSLLNKQRELKMEQYINIYLW